MSYATPKQVAFLKALSAERPSANVDEALIGQMTKRQASDVISMLMAMPKETAPAAAPVADPPVMIHYLANEDRILRVVKARTGRLYCKELFIGEHSRSWGYAGRRDLHKLDDSTVMTLDVMQAIGKTAGFCVRCAADLSDPESIARGMGPVCIKKCSAELAEVAARLAMTQLHGADYVGVA